LAATLLPAPAQSSDQGESRRRQGRRCSADASRLVAALKEVKGCVSFELEKEFGQTQIVNHPDLEAPPWHWPSR
jgi:hypothetical protein